jgi:hypothetical protein
VLGHWEVTTEVMTLKDHIYLLSGSDDSDWSIDDTIPPSHNAMESSMLSIFKVSKYGSWIY